ALEQRSGPRALDRDLAERGHVDQAHALAQGRGLLRQHAGVGRLGPAEGALLLPRPAPRLSGLAVVGALPAVLGGEDRAGVLHALVQRTRAPRTAQHVAVERVAQPVVVAVGLARVRGRIDRISMHGPEAPGPVGLEIQLALAAGHELGHSLADPARAAEAVEREPGGDEVARHARE